MICEGCEGCEAVFGINSFFKMAIFTFWKNIDFSLTTLTTLTDTVDHKLLEVSDGKK